MKNFRMKLSKYFQEYYDVVVYEGKCTINDNGILKGFVKTKNKEGKRIKSYLIGLKKDNSHMRIVQVWVNNSGSIEWPSSPIFYDVDGDMVTWEVYDTLYDYEYWMKRMGVFSYGNIDRGKAELNMHEISAYPLDLKEDEIIQKILDKNAAILRAVLDMDIDHFREFVNKMIA